MMDSGWVCRRSVGGLVLGLLAAVAGCGGGPDETADPPAAAPAEVTAGLQERSFGDGGSYLLFVPSGYDPRTPAPLIVGLHGRPGDSWQIENASRLGELAERETVLVAYPDQVNDEAGLRELLAQLRGELNVSQAYAAGFSAGGTAAWRVAATAPDLFAAIVSVGGPAASRDAAAPPTDPVAVLSLVGLADSSWFGQIETGLAHWHELLDCPAAAPAPVEADERVTVTTTECPDGSQLVTYRFAELGHVWPNQRAYGFDPNDVIWDFLVAHTDPG